MPQAVNVSVRLPGAGSNYAPAETFETVNTLGQPLYARMIPDRTHSSRVRLEIESNPAADLHPAAGAA